MFSCTASAATVHSGRIFRMCCKQSSSHTLRLLLWIQFNLCLHLHRPIYQLLNSWYMHLCPNDTLFYMESTDLGYKYTLVLNQQLTAILCQYF